MADDSDYEDYSEEEEEYEDEETDDNIALKEALGEEVSSEDSDDDDGFGFDTSDEDEDEPKVRSNEPIPPPPPSVSRNPLTKNVQIKPTPGTRKIVIKKIGPVCGTGSETKMNTAVNTIGNIWNKGND